MLDLDSCRLRCRGPTVVSLVRPSFRLSDACVVLVGHNPVDAGAVPESGCCAMGVVRGVRRICRHTAGEGGWNPLPWSRRCGANEWICRVGQWTWWGGRHCHRPRVRADRNCVEAEKEHSLGRCSVVPCRGCDSVGFSDRDGGGHRRSGCVGHHVLRRSRSLLVALAAITLALAVAQVQGTSGLPTPVQRFLSTTGQSGAGKYSTVATRVQGYQAVWTALGDGGWVGRGVVSGMASANDPRSVHNLILRAWYEAGWAGAVGMLCVLLGGVACALSTARMAATDNQRQLAVGIFGAMVAFIVFGLTNPLLSQRYGWVPLALAIAGMSLVRDHARCSTLTTLDAPAAVARIET